MGHDSSDTELQFHRMVEGIVDASTKDDIDSLKAQIADLRDEIAAIKDEAQRSRSAPDADVPVSRSSAQGKRTNLTRERARESAALRVEMLAALRAAVVASPDRRVEGMLYHLVESGAFGRVTGAKQASSLLQNTTPEEFGDLRVAKRAGASGTAVYTITIAGDKTANQRDLFDAGTSNDLDVRRAAALTKLVRASGGEIKGETHHIGLKLKELELWTGMELKSGHTLTMVLRQSMGRAGAAFTVSFKPATSQDRNPEWTLKLCEASK